MSLKSWLLETDSTPHSNAPKPAGTFEGAYVAPKSHHKTHSWWQVMCLTGVDYFSTLGYQPGIAALAAGAVAPLATLVLILLTLFGAVPIYSRVAQESPNGEGSVAMLEKLLRGWKGKLFVLVLLGFALTDFIITITLSAADATAHIIENPNTPHFLHSTEARIGITLALIALLGGVFLKGFKEAIGIAVVLVIVYLGFNVATMIAATNDLLHHAEYLPRWQGNLGLSAAHILKEQFGRELSNPGLSISVAALTIFPALALGLSGFETGVAVMPLVQAEDVARRVKNTQRLLLSAALIMSVFLIFSSITTTLIIPAEQFKKGGDANGRALAFLTHKYFGSGIGTAYDVSTIAILWFAGASAMAALLNLVPRYLPRYGMAPDWARASRPLTLVFMAIAFLVTILFKADVDAQGGAYATGVLVLITSASVAAALSAKSKGQKALTWFFSLVGFIFLYTTLQNIHERPEGLMVASLFILGIVAISVLSRIYRTTELRVERFDIDPLAQRFIDEAEHGTVRIIANEPDERDEEEYRLKEQEQREDNHIPLQDPVLFAEVSVRDASDFGGVVRVSGEERFGYRILRIEATTIPNALAALLLHIRDTHGGKIPHIYFAWTEGNPLLYILKYLAFGQGDVGPLTREVLREAESQPRKRPGVHVS